METDSKITLDKSIEEVVYILDFNPCGGDIAIDDILCYARTHFEGKPELIQSTLTLIKNKKTSLKRGWGLILFSIWKIETGKNCHCTNFQN